MAHRPAPGRAVAGLVVRPQRGAERRAGIAGGRLHPHLVERAAVAQRRVHHAVQRDAAGHREALRAGLAREPCAEPQHRVLERRLQRPRDVEVTLLERAAATSGRTEAAFEVERADAIAAVVADLEDRVERLAMDRLAVRRERHHLVLVGRMQEAEVARHVLVQQAERMRQVDRRDPSIVAAVEVAEARRRALAATVHRQHRGLVERRGEERARLVREVMLDGAPARPHVGERHAAKARREVMRRAVDELAGRVDDVRQEQRVPRRSPARIRRRLERQRDRRVAGRAVQQQRGVVRIGEAVDVGDRRVDRRQAVVDRVERQLPRRERHRPLAVLDVREALLLRRRDDDTVVDERSRAVVIDRVDAERQHASALRTALRAERCAAVSSSNSSDAATTSSASMPARHA